MATSHGAQRKILDDGEGVRGSQHTVTVNGLTAQVICRGSAGDFFRSGSCRVAAMYIATQLNTLP